MSNIELQIDALIDVLRTEEQKEKKRHEAAIDIEDLSEAKGVMMDAWEKIQQLRKWSESLVVLQEEIASSFLSVASTSVQQSVFSVDVESETYPTTDAADKEANQNLASYSSPGDYVRQKLYHLSKSGFVFSEEQLKNIQDYLWCRENLDLPHPLARIYDESKDILNQTSIQGTPRRYWVKGRFKFGDVVLLIYSGWAATYLSRFDVWYDSLGNALQIDDDSKEGIVSETTRQVNLLQSDGADSEENKVGYYVRSKLRELCEHNYNPSDNELSLWQDKAWSKRVLNLNYPFARVFSDRDNIENQTAVDNGKNRYWKEIFSLGMIKLLFCSQWYRGDRDYFDRWYSSLQIRNEEAPDAPELSLQQYQSDFSDAETETEPVITDVDLPSSFALFGMTYSAKSWDDILLKLFETIILKKPYKVLSIGVTESLHINGHPVLWLDERGESGEAHKLSNGLSLAKNKSGGEIISCCDRILSLCGYDRSELKIN